MTRNKSKTGHMPAGVKNVDNFNAWHIKYWHQLFKIKAKLLRHSGEKVVANYHYFNLKFHTNGVGVRPITYKWRLIPDAPRTTFKCKTGPKTMTQPEPKHAAKTKPTPLAKHT
ncbi:hypothetical protein GGI08_003642, partial [Coemansia sp. S2]